MTPLFADEWLTLIVGDCREVLRDLPDESVDCVVTSPPYWGLRDYGSPSQIGLEATPEAFVEEMVAVFREVRRLLRTDGTLWLNMGDSFAAAGNGVGSGKQLTNVGSHMPRRRPPPGLKPKDLVGIPWRVAFALQADGWWLRSDIIWHKPNAMPESVTDRPVSAHEHVFLLAKSKRYWFDGASIREPRASVGSNDGSKFAGDARMKARALHEWQGDQDGKRSIRDVWSIATGGTSDPHFAMFPEAIAERCILAGCPEGGVVLDPFAGTGTVGRVAQRLSRRSILIDINPDFAAIAMRRNVEIPLGLETAS